MPDITMCRGEGCDKRDTCYRHTATPSEYRQSWFVETPPQPCEYFGPNDNAIARGRATE